MHSYVNPAHEQRTAEILKKAMPALSITLSSEVCPEIREYERTSTAVANAYVQPLMDGYLARMDEALRVEQFRGAIYLVTSGGGLTVDRHGAGRFPRRLVELGSRRAARSSPRKWRPAAPRRRRCRSTWAGPRRRSPDRQFRAEFGAPLRSRSRGALPERFRPSAAHSGDRDGRDRRRRRLDRPDRRSKRVTVGPESAGSEPGPACYGAAACGRPSPTRCALGMIDPASFAGGTIALEPDLARTALATAVGDLLGRAADGRLRGARDGVREHGERGARARGRARRGGERSHADRVRRRGTAACRARRRKTGLARVLVSPNAAPAAVGFLAAPIPYELVKAGTCGSTFSISPAPPCCSPTWRGCARAGRAGCARRAGHRAAARLYALCRAGP